MEMLQLPIADLDENIGLCANVVAPTIGRGNGPGLRRSPFT
jgi:hypothetical protein